jgi:hypothetical protein
MYYPFHLSLILCVVLKIVTVSFSLNISIVLALGAFSARKFCILILTVAERPGAYIHQGPFYKWAWASGRPKCDLVDLDCRK